MGLSMAINVIVALGLIFATFIGTVNCIADDMLGSRGRAAS